MSRDTCQRCVRLRHRHPDQQTSTFRGLRRLPKIAIWAQISQNLTLSRGKQSGKCVAPLLEVLWRGMHVHALSHRQVRVTGPRDTIGACPDCLARSALFQGGSITAGITPPVWRVQGATGPGNAGLGGGCVGDEQSPVTG